MSSDGIESCTFNSTGKSHTISIMLFIDLFTSL